MESTRSLTLFNEMGDLTITWEADKDDEMAQLIQKKLDMGIRFFLVEPFNKSQLTEIKKLEDIKGRTISVPDADVEKLFTDGKVGLVKRVAGAIFDTIRPSSSAKEIAQHNAIATPQYRGG